MNASGRQVFHLDIPQLTIDEILNELSQQCASNLILQCTDNRRIDIGSLCFLNRDYKTRKIPKLVEPSSLSTGRIELIYKWCIENITRCKLSSTGETLFTDAEELASFTNWCDDRGHGDFHLSAFHYKQALDGYTQNLINRLHNGGNFTKISELRASRLQAAAINNATTFFSKSTDNFLENLPIISTDNANRSLAEKTSTPSEPEMREYLTSCQYMFDELTDFLLKELPFPHRFVYLDTTVLLVPAQYYISTPSIVDSSVKAQSAVAWDYIKGHIRSIEEIKALPKFYRHARRAIENAQRNLGEANEDSRHQHRLMIGQFAQAAFIPIFVANSAMNESQLRSLTWGDTFDIASSEKAGFVVIKQRAGDLEQIFEIKKTFLKKFKKFLELRNYLCGNDAPAYMFLRFTITKLMNKPLGTAPVQDFNLRMRSFVNPDFKCLTYRQLRKYKSIYLLSQNYSVSVVSAVLQNSPTTTLKHYTEANEKVAIDEISASIGYIINILDEQTSTAIPSGDCNGGGSSKAELSPSEYEPNCVNFVGCIYCTKYRLHADDESIRKVLSMRFVTAARLTSCEDTEHFDNLHGKALKRIDTIVANLIKIKPETKEIVDRVTRELTTNLNLSTYWEIVYHRLLKLKVIR